MKPAGEEHLPSRRLGRFARGYVLSAVFGTPALVLVARAFGSELDMGLAQIAVLLFLVGPLAGIPILFLFGAFLERNLVAVFAAIVLVLLGAYYGFGIGM